MIARLRFLKFPLNTTFVFQIFIGFIFLMGCSGNYRPKDFHVEKIVEQEKGTLQVFSRQDLENQAIKKLKRAGRYNEIEWEVEKSMLPANGLITFDPKFESKITHVQIENSVFTQTCKEKRDKKNANISADDTMPFTILPIPGPGIIVGINLQYAQNSNSSFYYFFCKPKAKLPHSSTVYLKNENDETINRYWVKWREAEDPAPKKSKAKLRKSHQ